MSTTPSASQVAPSTPWAVAVALPPTVLRARGAWRVPTSPLPRSPPPTPSPSGATASQWTTGRCAARTTPRMRSSSPTSIAARFPGSSRVHLEERTSTCTASTRARRHILRRPSRCDPSPARAARCAMSLSRPQPARLSRHARRSWTQARPPPPSSCACTTARARCSSSTTRIPSATSAPTWPRSPPQAAPLTSAPSSRAPSSPTTARVSRTQASSTTPSPSRSPDRRRCPA
mmetsp:Transcript_26659/g.78470  ORF Transcript_26659/g.78470 Transcript_26659/m.78470 type:complete len:232 (+) Transcript_26659:194-889(+)